MKWGQLRRETKVNRNQTRQGKKRLVHLTKETTSVQVLYYVYICYSIRIASCAVSGT